MTSIVPPARAGLRLATERLTLTPAGAALCRASLHGPAELAAALGVTVPSTWPPRDLVDALAFYASSIAARDGNDGWGLWLITSPSHGSLVGSAGFKGRPDRRRCVEIGYGIEPDYRRRGYATEAVAALLEWAWANDVERVVAECEVTNVASAAVLRRIGMTLVERRGKMLWWELRKPS